MCWGLPCVCGLLMFVMGIFGSGGGEGGLRLSSLFLSDPNSRRKNPGRSFGGFCIGMGCCLRGPPTVGLGAGPVVAYPFRMLLVA